MNKMDEELIDHYRLDLENRMRNLLWTVSGDYTLDFKPDVSLFQRSKAIALYDGIKQGALAAYFDKDAISMYLVKKIFLGADEESLVKLAQLCIEEAIGERIVQERPGVRSMQNQAFSDILEQEFEELPSMEDVVGRLKVTVLRDRLDGRKHACERQIHICRELLYLARSAKETLELIEVVDKLYNFMIDPMYEKKFGNLEKVLEVTLEDLTEFPWQDFLSEEMYEEALESYLQQLSEKMSNLEDQKLTEEMEEKRRTKKSIRVVPPEVLEKTHSYVEMNFGKTYLTPAEEKKLHYQMCRNIHGDCSLHFTEGILKNPVKKNYQYEYAKRIRSKNLLLYHEQHSLVKMNIKILTEVLQKSLVLRSESTEVLSDAGMIVPSRVWRVGRSSETALFKREIKGDISDFVVDVLIDASGSQMSRQGEVTLQAYILSEALSNVGLAHRVMSFCTFWDYTVLHRFRDYDDPRTENDNIFSYMASSNNRDGLAIKTAGSGLLLREEEKKILIVLSDGRPYDVILNRPNAKNPKPYQGKEAVVDTATQIRHLRNLGVSVLGVFAGEEKDLGTEKKIFGKDFAYIRDISKFSKIVGRYLTKQLENDD